MTERSSHRLSDARVFRATAIILATVAAAYIIWQLVDLLLLLFACALTALILLTITNILRRRTRLPFAIALTATVLVLVSLIVGASWFFGAAMREQFALLIEQLPAAWTALQARLQNSQLGAAAIARAEELAPSGQTIVGMVQTTLAAVGGAVSGLAIVLVGGLYLAAQPNLYGDGLLKLLPERARPQASDTFEAVAVSLKGWLKGQALGMAFVGIATGIGLSIIGVPAAPAIGLVAGLAEFVPYLGAIVAGVPAIILGFAQGTDTGLWTLGVLIGVQQIQGNIVMPLLQNRMVDLPPALTIFGIIAAGILLGPLGVILATPLTIVVLVLVRRLYLHEEADAVLEPTKAPPPSVDSI